MIKRFNMTRLVCVFLLLTILAGCAATHTAISKRNLEVQSRISTAIFIDPVAKSKRTIFLTIRSGVADFNRKAFKHYVKAGFIENDEGYTIIDDPEKAQYQMNIFVLNLEKTSPSAAEKALGVGYVGIGAGAIGGALLGGRTNALAGGLIGGLVGGLVGTVANAYVKDVTYMLVADVQIKEKAGKGVIVRKDSKINTKVSDAGASTQTFSEALNRKEYRTRIVTTANKANLELEEAKEEMFRKTAAAMSGFF